MGLAPASTSSCARAKVEAHGRAVAESAGIGEHGGVEAGGHLGRDGGARGFDQPVDELADAGGAAVDPVQVAPGVAGGVVVDIDDEKPVEAAQAGASQAVALQQNGGVVGAVNAQGGADGIGVGQGAVDGGNAVGGDQIGALAHLLEQHAHGQDAAHGIAVGMGVGADEERSPSRRTLRMASTGSAGDGQRGVLRRMGAASSMSGLLDRRLLALAGAVHQFVDAGLEAAGAVGKEGQVGDVAHAHALFDLEADVALGGFKPGDGVFFGLGDVGDCAVEGDVDARGLAAGVEHHFADVAEGDARIDELALDHGADLFAQRFGYAVLMMFASPVLRHDPRSSAGKPFRIAEG